jgi:hypothetical protein
MAVRDRGATPLAAQGSAAKPRHLGIGSGFVDEDQPLGIEVRLALEPELAAGEDIRALLLG